LNLSTKLSAVALSNVADRADRREYAVIVERLAVIDACVLSPPNRRLYIRTAPAGAKTRFACKSDVSGAPANVVVPARAGDHLIASAVGGYI
jgi:hypothetical protein